tara:strand:- start:4575 stop:5453 length:879 start_codon:yes stop_codon:yes gene_type:complete
MSNILNTDFSKGAMTAHKESKSQFLKENNIVIDNNESQPLPDGTAVVLGIALNLQFLAKKKDQGFKIEEGSQQAYMSRKGVWQVPFIMSVLSHNNVSFINSYFPAQNTLPATLEAFQSTPGWDGMDYEDVLSDIRSGSGSPQDNYMKRWSKNETYLNIQGEFISQVLSSAKNVMNDGTNEAAFQLGDDGFMAMNGMEFAAILKLEPSNDPQYADKNSVKKIILPNDPQYAEIMASRLPTASTYIPRDEATEFAASPLGKLEASIQQSQSPIESGGSGSGGGGEWSAPAWQTN